MSVERLVHLTVVVALLNIAATATLLFGRPDLTVRESSEKAFVIAMQLETEGKYMEASKIYENIFNNMSVTLIAPRAGARLADIYRRRLLDVDKARSVLREAAAFKGSVYADQAKKDLQFLDSHWDGDGSNLKLWYEASNSYRSKDLGHALDALNKLMKVDPPSSLKPLAMIRTAKILKEENKNDQAAQLLKEYLAAFPGDTGEVEARGLLHSVQ